MTEQELRDLVEDTLRKAPRGADADELVNNQTNALVPIILSKLKEREAEIIQKIKTRSEVRKAKPADEYERGYDHGYDDREKELLSSLTKEQP